MEDSGKQTRIDERETVCREQDMVEGKMHYVEACRRGISKDQQVGENGCCSVDPYGLAGQWVTDALNASVYTYEVAPVFTLLELELLESMRKMVGFQEGDGMLCPGGSLANGFAINLARFRLLPNVKVQGKCRRAKRTTKHREKSVSTGQNHGGTGEMQLYPP